MRVVIIAAICENPEDNWVATGWTREIADNNYVAAASFHPKPLYRIVIRRRL